MDKSNAWRMDPHVPLVVPEVNPEDARQHRGIIAGPNCSTTQMVVALWPLHQVNPIRRIIVDSYQAVSGTGKAAVEELRRQQADLVAGRHARRRRSTPTRSPRTSSRRSAASRRTTSTAKS